MRGIAFLSSCCLAAASLSQAEKKGCLVDGGQAISDALDASLFIWAASKRCGKKGENVKCTVDVMSAAKATNSMLIIILKALEKCDDVHLANKKCGEQAGKLTEHTTALTAAIADATQKCPAKAAAHGANAGPLAAPVECTVNLKNAATDLFKSVSAIKTVRQECDEHGTKTCASNALHVVAAFSGFGQYLAGSVGECRRGAAHNAKFRGDLCAQSTMALVEYLSDIASDGIQLAKKCESDTVVVMEQATELYEQIDDKREKTDDEESSPSLALGAFLPLVAFVSYASGRYYVNRRPALPESTELMSDEEGQE